MSGFWVIGKRQIQWIAIAMFAIMLTVAYIRWEQSNPVASPVGEEQTFHIVTGEFKTTTAAGKQIEVYRWDPGMIYAKVGEPLKLIIHGVNGAHHQFYIEGTEVRGEVLKGQETIVNFTPAKKGTYRLICTTHPGQESSVSADGAVNQDISSDAPMIGYIVVH